MDRHGLEECIDNLEAAYHYDLITFEAYESELIRISTMMKEQAQKNPAGEGTRFDCNIRENV